MFMPPLRGNFSRVLDVDPTAGTYRAGRYAGASIEETVAGLFSFTRSGTALDANAAGTLVSYGTNVVRDGYSGGVRAGWLIEGTATNLLPHSQNITSAGGTGWVVFGTAAGGGTTAGTSEALAPDGTQTATKLTSNSSGLDVCYQSGTVTASTQYTFSYYVRLGTMSVANYKFAVYNETGAAMIQQDIVPTQTPHANGWTRVTYTFTTPVGCVLVRCYPFRNTVGANESFYVWGAQLELGSFATSYVPTTATTATRNNDLLSMTGTQFSDVFSQASRTNLLLRSAEFDNASWLRAQLSSVTANALTDPFGGTSADTTTDDTNNAPHGVQQTSQVFAAGQQYTISCYMKAGTLTIGRLGMSEGANQVNAWFNLSGGTVLGVLVAGTTYNHSASIQSVGSGWYRCSATAIVSVNGTANGTSAIRGEKTNGATGYLGDGTGTLHLFGAQMETGGTATPYIPTAASTVTSTSPTQGAIIIDALFNEIAGATNRYLVQLDAGDDNNRFFLYNVAGSNQISANTQVAAVLQSGTVSTGTTYTAGTPFRIGMRWTPTAISVSVNGGTIASASPPFPAGLVNLRVGQSQSGTRPLHGRIRRMQCFRHTMSDAEFQARCTLGAG